MDDLIQEIKETTVSGDIAYIPGGFSSVSANLRKMSKNKKRWKIKINPDPTSNKYSIMSEGSEILSVQTKDMHQFQYDLMVESLDNNSALVKCIQEAIFEQTLAEAEQYNREGLKAALNGFPKNPSFSSMMSAVSTFTNTLRGTRINAQYGKSCLINHISFKSDIDKAIVSIEEAYKDDLGSIELIIDALNSLNPLNGFDVFNAYNYLLGSAVSSDKRYGNLVLETYISMSWIPTQKIFVSGLDDDIFEDLEHVFVSNETYFGNRSTVIYPKEKAFSQSDIVAIKIAVDEAEENE